MADVDIAIGSDTSAAAAGFAELRNYAEKARLDITRSFSSAISFTGLTGGLTAVTTAISSTIEKMHEIHHESERFGIDAVQLQLIGNAAQLNGLSLEQVARAMNLVQIAGAKAAGGTGPFADALNQLGIDATYFNSLNPAEKILAISQAWVAGSKSGEDYAAVAKLLGQRFGTELIPVLNQGAAGIKELSESMGILSTASVEKGEIIHQFWERLKNVVTVVVGTVIDYGFKRTAEFFLLWRTESLATSDVVIGAMQAIAKALQFDFSGAREALQKGFSDAFGRVEEFRNLAGKLETGGLLGHPPGGAAPAAGGGAKSGGPAEFTDASTSSDVTSGPGGGGGPSDDAELRKEISLRQQISKIEEESAAKNRTDEEQLAELQKQRVDLSQKYLSASEASKFTDTKASLDAELALSKNQQQIDTLTDQIAKDKLATQEKITKEREKEEAQAKQQLADAVESNKEFQFELQGRKDLADRAKIEYDYDKQIKDAKDAKAGAEAQGFTEAVKTNQALIEQLGLEKANALAAHDKAKAEKEAADVIEAKAKVDKAQEELTAVKLRGTELGPKTAAQEDAANVAKIQLGYQKEITKAVDEANQAWYDASRAEADGVPALAEQNRQLAMTKELTAANLYAQEQYNIALVAGLNAAKEFNSTRSGISSQQQQLLAQQGRTPQEIAALGGLGTGIAQIGRAVTYSNVPLLMATDPSTGVVNEAQYARNEALARLKNLQGQPQPWSVVDIMSRKKALELLTERQQRSQDQANREQTLQLENYYSEIASGRFTPEQAQSFLSQRVGAVQARQDIYTGTGFALPPGAIAARSAPNLGTGNAAQLQTQINLLTQQLNKLTSIDSRLTPRPGSH